MMLTAILKVLNQTFKSYDCFHFEGVSGTIASGNGVGIQACSVSLCLALLCFVGVAFLTNWKQGLPPAKDYDTSSQHSLSSSGPELNLQYFKVGL